MKQEKESAFAKIFQKWEEENESDIDVRKGQIVEGKVVSSDHEYIYLAVDGFKQEARVPISELGGTIPEIGSVISGLVKSKGGSSDAGFIISKKEADQRKSWEVIKEAYDNNYQITGVIVSEIPGKGFMAEFEGSQLFLPLSQLGLKKKNFDKLKNKELDFKIIDIQPKTYSAIVSHKILMDEINTEQWKAFLDSHTVGETVKATVNKIASFGVFCDVAGSGIIGLLRQNDISYKKFSPFKQYFHVGQEVELKILEIDEESKKLALGLKQLFEDPWEWAKRKLEKNMVVRGKVSSLTNFGAFIEFKEGLEGLIHSSELSWSKRNIHPKEILQVGEEIDVLILEIDFDKKRLSLGLKQLKDNPWTKLPTQIMVGNVIEGEITGIMKFGIFVKITDEIEGFIHMNEITWDERDKNPTSKYKKGEVIKFKILDINLKDQRISCGLKQLTEHPYEALRKKYPQGTVVDCEIKSVVSFGIFAEIEPGFEGLIHISEIPDVFGKEENLKEKYKLGDKMKASILRIDPRNKKISLSIKSYDKFQEEKELSKYIKSDETPSRESLGSFLNSSIISNN